MANHFERYKDIKSNLIVGKENPDIIPLITIVIPTYKRPKLLKEAVDSALNQKDFSDYEVVVVDNDTNNEFHIEKLINTYPKNKIKYYRNEKNIGIFGNWNRCIELSKGSWVSILHDDDYLKDDFLSTWHQVMQKNNSDYLMFSYDTKGSFTKKNSMLSNIGREIIKKILYFNENNRKLNKIDFFYRNQSVGLGTVMKKEKVLFVGGYDEDFYPCSDCIFWLQSLDKGISIYKHSKKVATYRYEDNLSLKKAIILGIISQTNNIARLALGNKNNLISHTFINSMKEYSAWRFYKNGLISKNEFKENSTNIMKSLAVVFLFSAYYFCYKAWLLINCKQ